jgi:hypothetical protein
MEKEKKIWKTMDSRNSILLNKENLWRICICNQTAKHDKRNDDEGIFVQPVQKKNCVNLIEIIL